MQLTQQRLIHLLLNSIAIFGVWIIYKMIEVNAIRGDEFLSYLHSDPRWTYSQIIQHIHGGADNSYTHAIVLRWIFGLFGHTIIVQRLLSLCFWLLGSILLLRIVKTPNNKGFNSFLLFCVGFANFGFFLATDGRFYSILFCLAVASLYVYFKKQQWKVFTSMIVFTGIQMLGLLTSPNFIVFQILFVVTHIAMMVWHDRKEAFFAIIKWEACLLLSVVLYFSFFKVPYFHTYFLHGFFTSVAFSTGDIATFVSIPFRWFMLPHFPFCSDRVDGMVFLLAVIGLTGYFAKKIVSAVRLYAQVSKFFVLMAIFLLLGIGIQLVLYFLIGIPMWESRYYATVFFVLPLAVLSLLRDVLSIKIMLLICCLWFMRLVAVEYPKLEARRMDLLKVSELQLLVMNNPKPSLFIDQLENRQSSQFVAMANVYIRFPNLRDKIFLQVDSTSSERTAYFKRLSDWHYPIGLTFEADSAMFTIP